jgi:hypothetical protein
VFQKPMPIEVLAEAVAGALAGAKGPAKKSGDG